MSEPLRTDENPSSLTRKLLVLSSFYPNTSDPTVGGDSESDTSTDLGLNESASVWLGRYLLTHRLGHGGMGTVYRAIDTVLDRELALKIPKLPLKNKRSSRWLNRFYREARIAAGFTHPNLCPIYDVAEHDGTHFLTMPLIRGESLAERLKQVGRLAHPDAARLVIRLAEAMQFAHNAGVIHRDLKPANVMISPPDDEPMIMDFGLAVSDLSQSPRITAQGTFLGTLNYCSPEQRDGNHSEVGPGSDIFSLGVILYQLLTGRLPFVSRISDDPHSSESKLYVKPSEVFNQLPVAFDPICFRALAKNPKDRHASMAELAKALSDASSSPETPAPPKAARRRSWAIPIGFALLLILLGVIQVQKIEDRPRTSRGTLEIALAVPPKPALDAVQPAAIPPLSERFLANSFWSGDFAFRPPVELKGAVTLRVTTRDGANFTGVYRSENRYEWIVSGTVDGKVVEWSFVKAIADAPHKTVVGYCDCRLEDRGGTLVGYFMNNQMNMKADMRLHFDK